MGKIFYWYVSVLIFPVLFFTLTQLFFTLSGVDFFVIALYFALIIFILIPVLALIFRKFLPEKDLRLEILFLICLVITILGLICTVNGNTAYVATEQPMNYQAIILSIVLFAAAFLIGFLRNKFKWAKRK